MVTRLTIKMSTKKLERKLKNIADKNSIVSTFITGVSKNDNPSLNHLMPIINMPDPTVEEYKKLMTP